MCFVVVMGWGLAAQNDRSLLLLLLWIMLLSFLYAAATVQQY